MRSAEAETVTPTGLTAERGRRWQEPRETEAEAAGAAVGFHGCSQPTAESTGAEGESGHETAHLSLPSLHPAARAVTG